MTGQGRSIAMEARGDGEEGEEGQQKGMGKVWKDMDGGKMVKMGGGKGKGEEKKGDGEAEIGEKLKEGEGESGGRRKRVGWWDEECEGKRREVRRTLREWRRKSIGKV